MAETPPRPETPAPKASRLERFIRSPVVQLASLLVGVVGLAVGFYSMRKEARRLTYCVDPERVAVLRARGVPETLVVYYGSPVPEKEVTLAQVAIWNKGEVAIKTEDVLDRLVIRTENGRPILAAWVKKSGRRVAPMTVDTGELGQGRVSVGWRILEQNDGGVIQLLYAGDPALNFRVEGTIIGQNQVTEQGGKYGWLRYAAALLGVLAALAILAAWHRAARAGPGSRDAEAARRICRVATALAAAMAAVLFCLGLLPRAPLPPFGF